MLGIMSAIIDIYQWTRLSVRFLRFCASDGYRTKFTAHALHLSQSALLDLHASDARDCQKLLSEMQLSRPHLHIYRFIENEQLLISHALFKNNLGHA